MGCFPPVILGLGPGDLRREAICAAETAPRPRPGVLSLTTGQLCEVEDGLDRCTVMQHLKALEAADLIIIRREGRERWNHPNAMPIKAIQDRWLAPYTRGAVAMLADLKARVES